MITLDKKEIKKILTIIALKTFPNKKLFNFDIILSVENKKKHGAYFLKKRKIFIYNLSREREYIIKTTLHELAHHCENSLFQTTNHQKRFYHIYKMLLITAIKEGLINWNNIKQDNIFTKDIQNLIKYVGDINIKQINIKQNSNKIIKIFNIENENDIMKLKTLKYRKSLLENCYFKTIKEEFCEKEMNLITSYNFKIFDSNNVESFPVYNLFIIKYNPEDLQKYINLTFKMLKNKVLYKQIQAKDLIKEKQLLLNLKIKCKIKISLPYKTLKRKKIKKKKN